MPVRHPEWQVTVGSIGRVTANSSVLTVLAELIQANLLEVDNERDDDRRRAAMIRPYAPDVTFSDPDELVIGHDALTANAQSLLDESPNFVTTPAARPRSITIWATSPPHGLGPVLRLRIR